LTLKNLRSKFIISLLLGMAVAVGLMAYGDFSDIIGSLGDFRWELLPLLLALSMTNYLIRFAKWHFYLGQIGVRDVPKLDSFLAYFSGLGMVITPGKLGEWLKSYLLQEMDGVPFIRTAPILLAERFTDSLALLLLASAGFFLFGEAWEVFAIVIVGSVIAMIVARHRPTMRAILHWAERLPLVSRFASQAEVFYESTYVLFSPWSLIFTTVLSFFSWGGEVLAFYLVLVGLGQEGSWMLLVQAAFILPVSTLAGAIVLVAPGGLGVAEGGFTGLLQVIVEGMSKSVAALATLIIRFTTLWFGVMVGLIVLAVTTRRLAAAPAAGGPPGAAIPAGADPLPTMAASAEEGNGRSVGSGNKGELLK
jgi:glycosyltransferase 2 family protein